MSELNKLLKEKSYSELTELERAFVLQNMSAEDYETEHQIVIMTEKLKLSQAHLTPQKAIKTELMAKMHAKTRQKWVVALPYGIAASLLLFAGIFYFSQKKTKGNLIVENKIENKEPIIIAQKTTIIDSSNLLITELKTIKNKPKKQNKKPVLLTNEDAEEKALLLSFNRKNPNLEWQSEDEEEDLDKSTLKCSAN
jgi:hypothetical protein